MVEIKGHKKAKAKRRSHPWPGKYIPKHTEGHCPYCHKPVDNVEAHIKSRHKFEKQLPMKGKVHGHD